MKWNMFQSEWNMFYLIWIVFLFPAIAWAEKYDHAVHDKLQKIPCESCHALAPRSYEPIPPGGDAHKPCSNSACHGPRMSLNTKKPFCDECHENAQPWSASAPRLLHRDDAQRDFGWRINHRRHLDVPGLSSCDTCHQLSKLVNGDEVKVMVHRPGHVDCAPCHGKQGSNPNLSQCASCHVAGHVTHPKPHEGAQGKWRVYEKFSHDDHRLDVRTARLKPRGVGRGWSRWDKTTAETLGCGTCHATVGRADRLEDIDLLGPCAMNKTCMGQCHNGKYAFQGSGTNLRDCLLCHTGVDENTPAPASHCGSN
jgi:hypothetical protein